LVEKGDGKLNHKIVVGLLITALCLTTFAAVKITPAHAPGNNIWRIPIDFPTLEIAIASGFVVNNDEIHILAGQFEVLSGPITIWQNGLWIIGSPPSLGPTPTINVNGFVITVLGSNVFIWGLNIIDPTGASPALINLAPPSANCLIMNNIITGAAPPNTGILVQGTNNVVTLNTISFCGWCIDVTAPSSGNIVKLNTINVPNNWGIQVSGGVTANNAIYWNNVWTLGPLFEFWDATPGSPPNWFDDTSAPGGPSFTKGNYWGTTVPPPLVPFPIPGPGGNGWFDFFPQPAPIAQIQGDVNVDGRVNIFDIVTVAVSFNEIWCQLGWDPLADPNGDGTIDIFDIVAVAVNFGATY